MNFRIELNEPVQVKVDCPDHNRIFMRYHENVNDIRQGKLNGLLAGLKHDLPWLLPLTFMSIHEGPILEIRFLSGAHDQGTNKIKSLEQRS